MVNYKKFLIQQQTYNGASYVNVGYVIDTQMSFNVVCQEFPFKYLPETKDLASRNWYDEHGSDTYIPEDGLKFKEYDIEAKFLYVGSKENVFSDINAFIEFLYGRNVGGSPLLAIYDEYTKTGRRGVVVVSVDNDIFFYNDTSIDAIAQFKVKFKITDPVTNIVLSNE